MNKNTSLPTPSALIARRLLAREVSAEGKPELVGEALQDMVVRVSTALCNSLGNDGCDALLARALARTEPRHSALKSMHFSDNGRIHLDGVVASVETHGVVDVTEAIEALLAALIDILSRLIGEDMAIRLIDQNGDAQRPRSSVQAQAP